jgi:3-oxoacyl-[acyl-carrier-protein] synthase II
VITGVGALTAHGQGINSLMQRWADGECAIQDGEARCSEFDPSAHFGGKEARRLDRFAQLALVAADEALNSAGWKEEPPCEPSRAGCIIGTAFGGIQTIENQIRGSGSANASSPSATAIPMLLSNAATAGIAIRRQLKGPCFPVGSSCAAGADAIAVATRMIQSGDADVMIAGAAEAPFARFVVDALKSMRALSSSGISRPFDARRDGFVLGEGAAVIVLEAASTAHARGAPIIGEILGVGIGNDAFHITMPDPDGSGFASAMTRALEDAVLDPATVDYVNAHGTSTPRNDRVETLGLKRALAEHAHRIPVSSTKSAIGHLLGAAGAIDVVATLAALSRREAPPTLGLEEPDAELDLDYVPSVPRPLSPSIDGERLVGLSNSAGFGGHNTSICLAGCAGARGES